MADLYKMTPAKRKRWDAWVATLPEVPRKVAMEYVPWKLYELNPPGQRVTVESYADDGTLTVLVSAKYNLVTFERGVFGINPGDLKECELPDRKVVTGQLVDPADVEAFIDEVRPAILAARQLDS